MAKIGTGAPSFVVRRPPSPQSPPSDLPYLAEPGYYEMSILDAYHQAPRFPIPTGVLVAGSAAAELAMRVPQRDPRPPALLPGHRRATFLPVCLAASLLVCLGAGVGLVVNVLRRQEVDHSP